MAENATHNLHNLLTLRGALVRDPHIWAHYLTEAIELFASESDVVRVPPLADLGHREHHRVPHHPARPVRNFGTPTAAASADIVSHLSPDMLFGALTVPAPALTALARGNLDAARSNGLTTSGDESQLASLFSVLQPGDPSFNIVEP